MNRILETERLILREFSLTDAEFIIELLNSPGWLRFIGDRNVKSTADAEKYLTNGPMKSYKENGFGLSLVERKADGAKIGMCGIIKRANLEYPDIGFAFLPGAGGKGYAFEIARATLEYARNRLQLPKICAITLEENERSIRLLEKLGLRFVRTMRFENSQEELQLYCD
ncbi:MAG TPA: GNAT family N-acetyltransferase [Flavisolibacter sp.]|nr:GNAT family N-acetyltransferase [Flavisolibacter sp.]